MPPLSLSGRVVRATDLQPLSGVAVRLHGLATALAGLRNVQPVPPNFQISWTRQLSGFAGSRWDCWTAQVQGKVAGITWEQFRDGALTHNPSLQNDRLFKADQTYLLPEQVALPSYTWTRRLNGFAGSRWDCWTAQVQGKVPGITWERFRDDALLYNPQLNADQRMFNPAKAYLLPEPNTTSRAFVETVTDQQGGYVFALADQPGVYELQVEVDDYARFVLPLVVNGALTQPISLMPQPNDAGGSSAVPVSGNIRSARTDYATLPGKARGVIDWALGMLGDDAQTFDALPPQYRAMCYGARFLADPNHYNYKDIVCADLISIALKAAGCDITWSSTANPNMADYYHPDRGNVKLIEITNANDWLPGDILVYGNGAPNSRAGHVNLYVGPFSGTDRSGTTYPLSAGMDVIEASKDFPGAGGRQLGTGVIGANLQRCVQNKRGAFSWVRHVRLRELAAAFGR